eukprot:5313707-Amphidinium_carterae.1
MVGPMQSHCATWVGDDQWDIAHSRCDGSVTGEIPMKGRSKLFRAESYRTDRYMDPASPCQKNLHMGPARRVTTEWDTAHLLSDGSPDGWILIGGLPTGWSIIPIEVYQHTTPESARDLVHHIPSVIAQRLRFRIRRVNLKRKDDAIKS